MAEEDTGRGQRISNYKELSPCTTDGFEGEGSHVQKCVASFLEQNVTLSKELELSQ